MTVQTQTGGIIVKPIEETRVHLGYGVYLSNGSGRGEQELEGVQLVNGVPYRYFLNGYRITYVTNHWLDDIKDLGKLDKLLTGDQLYAVFPFFRNFRGHDIVDIASANVKQRLKELERHNQYKAKIRALTARYPQVPEDLVDQLYNFDWTYTFSDDNSSWRAGARREEELIKCLERYNAKSLFKEWSVIYFSRTAQT